MKASTVLLCIGSLLLLSAVSCNKESAVDEEPLMVVEHGTVTTRLSGAGGADTKATYTGDETSGTLNWTVGDKIVMASNNVVNGTLTCTAVDGSGNATFKGGISQFTPASVNFFYLGGQAAGGINATYDLSSQSGTAVGLAKCIYLKKMGLVLEETEPGSEQYQISGGAALSFDPQPLVSFIKMNLEIAGTPTDEVGVKVKSVEFQNLANKMRLNLMDGSLEAVADETATKVGPGKSADYARSYIMAVVPQTIGAEGVSMKVNYSTNSSLIWTDLWTGQAISSDNNYTSSPSSTPKLLSAKIGYAGNTIGGGENADGMSHKFGYNGNNADGTSDTPTGQKGGYNGNQVN